MRLVYQRIGQSKSSLKLPKKRRKKSSDDGIKCQKVRRSFGEIQWGSVNLNLLIVPELKTYLHEHKLKKSGKKPALVERIERHMHKQHVERIQMHLHDIHCRFDCLPFINF